MVKHFPAGWYIYIPLSINSYVYVHVNFLLTSPASWVRKIIRNMTVICKQWPSIFACWLRYIYLTLSIAHKY